MKNLEQFYQTGQSTIYETPAGTLIKVFNTQKDFQNELCAYKFLTKKGILNTPRIISVGDGQLEIEFLEKIRESTTREIVESIVPLYSEKETNVFRDYDLTKEKLKHRLGYLGEEIEKRNVSPDILRRASEFVDGKYQETPSRVLVHGDLKPIHAIPTREGIKFIDFALFGKANPFYDIAFLHMAEQKDKEGTFRELINLSSPFSDLSKAEREALLQSNIFNRTLYNLGFALRHRPDKSLERVVKELNHIMEYPQ
ncbi:hypothetical protein COU58_01095 [Candidatus Pacearchaeota archaeon CG10_big_fil_rev_8_21_14_0_10_32_42]|nr:MAG: hypothetical protein COU58_01095 [Candidatus Pacearchaeota archaeon CG10_big_fil_rev_8_21_14_0_10_32_42]